MPGSTKMITPAGFEDHSWMTPLGYQDGECGYCKDPATSQKTPRSRGAYFARSKRMTVEHYQRLVHRGWRRSGTTLYKPDQLRSCCPHYTIRLPVAELRPSRDQRQALHRWNRFVLGDKYVQEAKKLYSKTKSEKKQKKNEFDLLFAVHESEYTNVKIPPEPDHRFEVRIESNEFTEEKYELFEQYQRQVHKEPPSRVSRNGFKRFLCDSPLVNKDIELKCGRSQLLGSYHQCYRLDGKLIALGVIDLLPSAVSAVYLIYHLDYEKWSFGKLSALREAALALEGGYQYYKMGFYIHSCPKMRYKCDYKPQYILDPDTFRWNELDEDMKARLDRRKFVSPSRDEWERLDAEKLRDGSNGRTKGESEQSGIWENYSTPAEALDSGESLLSFGIPGSMNWEQTNEVLKWDTPLVAIPKGEIVPALALVQWDEGPVTEESEPIKRLIAELVACLGPEVTPKTIFDFSP